MIQGLMSLPKQVANLLTRLSATWAAKLDALRAGLSDARMGYLDRLDTAVSGVGKSCSQEITSGSGTFTVPAGVYKLHVLMVGGGGSGSIVNNGTAGGGAGGAVIWRPYSVYPGQVLSYSVGAGGAARSTRPSNGLTGGSTYFGAFTAAGGVGGSTASEVAGSGYTSVFGTAGGAGGRGANANGGASVAAGGVAEIGGYSAGGGGGSLGAGGNGRITSVNGGYGVFGGGGGAHAGSGAYTSGAGGDGYILIEWTR